MVGRGGGYRDTGNGYGVRLCHEKPLVITASPKSSQIKTANDEDMN